MIIIIIDYYYYYYRLQIMNWHDWCSAMTVPESTPAPISTQSRMIFQIGAFGHLIVPVFVSLMLKYNTG